MTTWAPDEVDRTAANTLRFLAADMVQRANSGHPGMPMGMAPAAWTLFSRHLRHDPADATWADRDRFVLSAGHGAAVLYSPLHVFGYDLPTEQLQRFRQFGSTTPGHPEFGHTDGVETTTGHLGFGRLTGLWDDNHITIDGPVAQSSRDNQLARSAAAGWRTASVADGEDMAATKRAAGWNHPDFTVPAEVATRARELAHARAAAHRDWKDAFDQWPAAHPDDASTWHRTRSRQLPADLAESTGTHTGQAAVTRDDSTGATIHFGIREFEMAALMRQPVIYVLTHDSVALGQDGPTHQPVEHVEALRQIPGVTVLRPADDVETVAAGHTALANTDGPTVLVLTRHNVTSLGAASSTFITAPGSRVVRETAHPDVQILASGSSVAIALDAAERMASTGVCTQVVSVPWREKDVEFHEASARLTVSVEAGVTGGWAAFAGLRVGVDEFGASGKAADVLAHFGPTADAEATTITAALGEQKGK
ncbi:MAG: hypothetical protein H5T82_08840 [Demequina sp.]|nr:hypothetical protein [Demequina sp.]